MRVRALWLSNSARSTARITLRAPVIVLVLAATAIPIELRLPSHAKIDLGVDDGLHFLVNVAGYLPVGIVLARLGLLRAVTIAAFISVFVEIGQLAMVYRDPSIADVVANVLGAILGAAVARHWSIPSPELSINRWNSLVATAFASAIVLWVWARSGGPVNPRGWASPGILEARWNFDEKQGRVAWDSSGHNLHGRFSNEPVHVAGAVGTAAVFDGRKGYVDVGRTTALRLVGSMTITAWIYSTAFPMDDAAIVSQFDHGLGYQLDTTVDRGPRTIGFKLTNACGDLMMRYGRTPFVLDTWYHVAGVYDAPAKTLDVYVNGEMDNGFLLGDVTGTQHPSRAAVYLGRRTDLEGFGFTGIIDDVHIYSIVLSKAEIVAVMHGLDVDRGREKGVNRSDGTRRTKNAGIPCAVLSEPYDIEIPLAAAAVGVLAAVACVGLWPVATSVRYVAASFAAGLLFLPGIAFELPSFNLVLIPLTSIAGGACVVLSMRPSERS